MKEMCSWFVCYFVLSHGNVIDRNGENCFLLPTKTLSLSFNFDNVVILLLPTENHKRTESIS